MKSREGMDNDINLPPARSPSSGQEGVINDMIGRISGDSGDPSPRKEKKANVYLDVKNTLTLMEIVIIKFTKKMENIIESVLIYVQVQQTLIMIPIKNANTRKIAMVAEHLILKQIQKVIQWVRKTIKILDFAAQTGMVNLERDALEANVMKKGKDVIPMKYVNQDAVALNTDASTDQEDRALDDREKETGQIASMEAIVDQAIVDQLHKVHHTLV